MDFNRARYWSDRHERVSRGGNMAYAMRLRRTYNLHPYIAQVVCVHEQYFAGLMLYYGREEDQFERCFAQGRYDRPILPTSRHAHTEFVLLYPTNKNPNHHTTKDARMHALFIQRNGKATARERFDNFCAMRRQPRFTGAENTLVSYPGLPTEFAPAVMSVLTPLTTADPPSVLIDKAIAMNGFLQRCAATKEVTHG